MSDLYNMTNVKNLPEVEQITNGNYIIVENDAGTNKLVFENFVIGPENTSFFDAIATDLYDLSAYDQLLFTTLSSVSASLVYGISGLRATISVAYDKTYERLLNNLSAVRTTYTNYITSLTAFATSTTNNILTSLNSSLNSLSGSLSISLNSLLSATPKTVIYSPPVSIPRFTTNFYYLTDIPITINTPGSYILNFYSGISRLSGNNILNLALLGLSSFQTMDIIFNKRIPNYGVSTREQNKDVVISYYQTSNFTEQQLYGYFNNIDFEAIITVTNPTTLYLFLSCPGSMFIAPTAKDTYYILNPTVIQ